MSENKTDTLKDGSADLESRIVAWVLGEASPFETDQMAQQVAANPELAVFKRRIQAVHGLLGEAARPPAEPLRLSPERRKKLLQIIGVMAPATAGTPTVLKKPLRSRAWIRWIAPVAACLALGLVVGSVLLDSLPLGPSAPMPLHSTRADTLQGASDSLVEVRLPEPELMDKDAEPPRVAEFFVPNGPPPKPELSALKALDSQVRAGAGQAARMPPVPVIKTEESYGYLRTNSATATETASGSRLASSGAGGKMPPISVPPPDVARASFDRIGAASAAPATAAPVAERSDGATLGAFAVGALSSRRGQNEADRRVAEPGSSQSKIGEMMYRKSLPRAEDAAMASDYKERLDAAKKREAESAQTVEKLKQQEGRDLAVKDQNELLAQRKAGVGPEAPAKTKIAVDDDPVPARQAVEPMDESLRRETSAATEPVSTFSLHVGDASFRVARDALAQGQRPDPASIRPEEFYNAFDYGDPGASAGEPVTCRIEQSAHPFLQQRNLVRVAVRVPASGRAGGRPLRLTVMLDTSGSMEREDRAATVLHAFQALASLLGPNDVVTVVGFAREPRLLADRVPGTQAASLADIVAHVPAEGGTNLDAALQLAGEMALRQRIDGAQNRIVLLTDGAANLGNADPAQLSARIVQLRQQGIAFDACGVGADSQGDRMLEALTRQGDGRYQALSSPEDADAGFARRLAGAFRPAAENVKVQARFNSARVGRYRLIGFEQHRLREEDFRNDKVDAAELAAEEAAVALYQVEVLPEGEGELGEVFVRFRDPASGLMVERAWTLAYNPQPLAFARATPSMKLAGVTAFLAEKLRGGELAAQIRLQDFSPALSELRGVFTNDARVAELATMFAQARRVVGD